MVHYIIKTVSQMTTNDNSSAYPNINANQYSNPSYQNIQPQPQFYPYSQPQLQGYVQPQSAQGYAQPQNTGYFAPSGQIAGSPQNYPYSQNQIVSPIVVPPKQNKLRIIAIAISFILMVAGCSAMATIRTEMDSCYYWDFQTCYYSYESYCCSTATSYSCPSTSQIYNYCWDIETLREPAATTFTMCAIFFGVSAFILFILFIIVMGKYRKDKKNEQVLLTAQAQNYVRI